MPRNATPTAPHGRIAGLDLIRGGAIALVLFKHGFPAVSGTAGIVGVVAFFALSGYLITGILRRDIDKYGHVRFGRFYRNRVLRLFPPLLLMLAVVAIVTVTVNPFGDRSRLWVALIIAVLYLTDLPVPIESRVLTHLWTLATEEQFYVIWPWLLTFGLRRKRMLLVVLAAGTAIIAVLLLSYLKFPGHINRFYQLPTSWCIAMLIGAAAQIWGTPLARLGKTARAWGAIAALLVIAVMLPLSNSKEQLWLYLGVGPATALCTVLIIEVVRHWVELPTRWLRPLLSLGTVSYAAYLWNWPIVNWLGPGALPLELAFLSVLLTLAAAFVSYWTLERPIARVRRLLDDAAGQRVRVTDHHEVTMTTPAPPAPPAPDV